MSLALVNNVIKYLQSQMWWTLNNKSNKLFSRHLNLLPTAYFKSAGENSTWTIHKFLDKRNILYKFQSGFRKNHSTDFCLSYLADKIYKGFDSGLLTGVILIDLHKTFDTIDHNILTSKNTIVRVLTWSYWLV